MDYNELCKYYEKLDSTTKRLEKTDILVEFLKKVNTKELKEVIYLLQGTVFPAWDERKLGFSSQLIIKALNLVTGNRKEEITRLWRKYGDLGLVAEDLSERKEQRTLRSEKLTVKKVFSNLEKLATLEGKGTVSNKVQLVSELLGNASPIEAKYVVRTILGILRVGVAAGILRDSIAKTYKKDVKKVEEAFNLAVDYGEVAILAKGNKLGRVEFRPLKPLQLMLALPAANIESAFKGLGKPAQFEFKMDGFRLQVHKDKEVKMYTRRLEDVTSKFPDIVDIVNKKIKAKSFIIDCEAVGVDKKTRKYLPFQKISQRIKRKYHIEEMARDFPVELNVFDVLYYNGKNLFDDNLKKRRALLEKIVKQEKGRIVVTKKLVTDSVDRAKSFFKEALKNNVEGLMAKNITAKYRPGRYVRGWMKLKEISEPLDLVVVKAEWGEGKRASLLSSYTVACLKDGKFVEIGKVSTGMKEKAEGLTFKEMTKMLKPLIEKQKGREVIVKPKIVVEIGYEEIQKSPKYNSGYALRFPRVLRLRTDEKTERDVNTIKEVERIYKSQKK